MPIPFNSTGKVERALVVYTEAGHEHLNEDAVVVQRHLDDNSILICILADGQGGQSGGAAASRMAVDKCLELALAQSAKRLLTSSTWYEILIDADKAVSDGLDTGFTTLIGLCLNNHQICGASCGDSTAMVVRQSHFELLTEKQRKNPPVGSGAAFPVAFSAKFEASDKLLVVSDGVWRFVGYDVIAGASREKSGRDLVAALRQLQIGQNGGRLHDDFSLIVVE